MRERERGGGREGEMLTELGYKNELYTFDFETNNITLRKNRYTQR